MEGLIVWYDRYERSLAPVVGGKNAGLGELTSAGLPVPPGFALTTDAYRCAISAPGLADAVDAEMRRLDPSDPTGAAEASGRIRSLVESAPLAGPVAAAITDGYLELGRRCGRVDVPVAVRSSATAEDLPDASFAGQQDTFLWVSGVDDVLDAVRKCWSSVFTDRAIAYRHERGVADTEVAMSVGIQQMVDAVSAGVAFTLNPTSGDRSQVAIESSWGLGETVVAGEVTPDDFLVDKVTGQIIGRSISSKRCERVVIENAVRQVPVPPERVETSSLTDAEVLEIAELARHAERHHGAPQDLEWAIGRRPADRDRVGAGVLLLQCRPETVWSQLPPTPVDAEADLMTSMIDTLLAPVRDAGRTSATHPSGR